MAPSWEQKTAKIGEIHGTVNLGFKPPVHEGYIGTHVACSIGMGSAHLHFSTHRTETLPFSRNHCATLDATFPHRSPHPRDLAPSGDHNPNRALIQGRPPHGGERQKQFVTDESLSPPPPLWITSNRRQPRVPSSNIKVRTTRGLGRPPTLPNTQVMAFPTGSTKSPLKLMKQNRAMLPEGNASIGWSLW